MELIRQTFRVSRTHNGIWSPFLCGPGSSSLRNACLMYGACGYTDLEQAYQQAVFQPRDWQRLNARRYQIHQALYAGQFELGIAQ